MATLSLCICTMNRPEELATALRSVFAGTVIPDQVLVSDDGDGSAKDVAEAFPGVTYLDGPKRGLGANRNHCIAAATSELIAFIDDDVTVAHDFAEKAKAAPTEDTITTGWELNHSTIPARKVSAHNASFLGFQRVEPGDHLNAICINATVFPSGLFERALFDEQIKYGYEEIDIARHATSLGWRITYDDSLHVSHFPAASNRDAYAAALNVSRLYITHKAYAVYENNRVKAGLFNIAARGHHLLYSLKNGHGLAKAISTIRESRSMQRALRAHLKRVAK